MRACLLLLTLLLGACSTPYQGMGLSGGVESQQLTADTYRIIARGNSYTSATSIQDYALLKAAETTKAAGGSHFAVVGNDDRTRRASISTEGRAETHFVGNSAYTTYTAPDTQHFIKPGQDTVIKVLNLAPGSQIPQGAISAEEIIQFVSPRVKKGS